MIRNNIKYNYVFLDEKRESKKQKIRNNYQVSDKKLEYSLPTTIWNWSTVAFFVMLFVVGVGS